ncbi:hypothetical protein Pla108_33320 [Botrimarina colliarenosi]|uniref:SCP domain-containing protein n=1 Tax=Botrimarina colliarenosi TaxID=2528001 RepID=A0A5C6A6P9_9BACT|nr:hypothetical protein [Botrimarina colliarenosi]TWT95189.1 hypothetical protein Pla108_33320 [Botrimarina colliarenosi]
MLLIRLLTLSVLLLATVHSRADETPAVESPLDGNTVEGKAVEDQPAEDDAVDEKVDEKTVEAGGLKWHTDYYAAYREAAEQQRMLLVSLTSASTAAKQAALEAYLASRPQLREKLGAMTLFRADLDTTIDVDGASRRLADFAALSELRGGAGLAIVDLQHEGAPYYGHTVTALPFANGKYYRWSPQGLATAIDLPAGTLTQRSLVWAVRMHPEAPQSTGGRFHAALASGANEHASFQARVRRQGHQNFSSRFQRLSSAAGSSVTEVCAESWPGQTLMDSVVDCVASWRHSSGHWRGVSRPHRAYAYDIQRGGNGIWYATGLFAD